MVCGLMNDSISVKIVTFSRRSYKENFVTIGPKEMGGSCALLRVLGWRANVAFNIQERNLYTFLVRKPQEPIPVGRSRLSKEDNIKTRFWGTGWRSVRNAFLWFRIDISDGIVNTVMECIRRVQVAFMTSGLIASHVELGCMDSVS
jgi:hypothetical protein